MPEVVIVNGMAPAFEKALGAMRDSGCDKGQDVTISECGSRIYVPFDYSNKLIFLVNLIAKVDFGEKVDLIKKKPKQKNVLKEKKPRAEKKTRGAGTKSSKRKKRQAIAARRHN